MIRNTKFLPSLHSFRFTNEWPAVPLTEVDLGQGIKIPIGKASNGLCGGMAFANLDVFLAGRYPPPVAGQPRPDSSVYMYIVQRMFDSFSLPVGPVKMYLDMMPTTSVVERARDCIERDWPTVKTWIDAGTPIPILLMRAQSFDPFDLGKNHVVLAYGYQQSATWVSLRICDPNRPKDDNLLLTFDTAMPARGFEYAPMASAAWRRPYFFRTYNYTQKRPPDWPQDVPARIPVIPLASKADETGSTLFKISGALAVIALIKRAARRARRA